jgi:hypothetical protein
MTEDWVIMGDVRIPTAYTIFEDWLVAHPGMQPNENDIRYLEVEGYEPIIFVYKENRALRKFRRELKKYQKLLGKAIQKELDLRGIPIWCSPSRASKRKRRLYRKVSFLLVPPLFLSTCVDKSNRDILKENEDKIYLHFDEDKVLQTSRHQRSSDSHIASFRLGLGMDLDHNHTYLTKHFGKWEVMAVGIVNIIQHNLVDLKEYFDEREVDTIHLI